MTSTAGPTGTAGQMRLATALAMIAGCVDAYAFIRYQTYVSFMSGNTTQSGSALGQFDWALAAPALTAIAAFVVGVFAGTLLSTASAWAARRVRFAIAALVLAAILAITPLGLLASGVYIGGLSFGMGVMNTCLAQIGSEAVSLTFVTGALNRIGTHAALAIRRVPLTNPEYPGDSHVRRALRLTGLWMGFLFGACIAGAATPRFGEWVLLPPLLALVGLTVADRER
ncbi:MAG: YoaK family protein [bacterium]